MFNRKNPEVLIVGAGPVGLFAALALKRKGIDVYIVDEAWGAGGHSYALALHPSTHRLMADVGLLDKVLKSAYRIDRIAFYDGSERRRTVELSAANTEYPFVSVLRQDVLEDLLVSALGIAGLKVHWDHEASLLLPNENAVEVRVDRLEMESLGYSVAHSEKVVASSRTMRVPFVIGSDGHRSDVRRSLSIEFQDLGGTKQFAVFEFKTDADLGHEMRAVFHGGTTNVAWPMPDGYVRWSFEIGEEVVPTSRTKDRFVLDHGTERYPTLDEDHLHDLLSVRAPWFEGSVDEIAWRKLVRFERRLAESFGRGRVWLAGDAAHMTGPVGVQSMNAGLHEAADLAERLRAVLREGAPISSLDEYGTFWLDEWKFLLGLDGGLAADNAAQPWASGRKGALLPCLPVSRPDIEPLLSSLGLHRRQVMHA